MAIDGLTMEVYSAGADSTVKVSKDAVCEGVLVGGIK